MFSVSFFLMSIKYEWGFIIRKNLQFSFNVLITLIQLTGNSYSIEKQNSNGILNSNTGGSI